MGLITGALLSGGRLYLGTHDLMYFFCLQEVGLITGGLLSVCVCVCGVCGGVLYPGGSSSNLYFVYRKIG